MFTDLPMSRVRPSTTMPTVGLLAFEIRDAFEPPDPVRQACLLYTSDAADERSSVDLGGRRIIKKKNIGHITRIITIRQGR